LEKCSLNEKTSDFETAPGTIQIRNLFSGFGFSACQFDILYSSFPLFALNFKIIIEIKNLPHGGFTYVVKNHTYVTLCVSTQNYYRTHISGIYLLLNILPSCSCLCWIVVWSPPQVALSPGPLASSLVKTLLPA
jgi:hypothetical protein